MKHKWPGLILMMINDENLVLPSNKQSNTKWRYEYNEYNEILTCNELRSKNESTESRMKIQKNGRSGVDVYTKKRTCMNETTSIISHSLYFLSVCLPVIVTLYVFFTPDLYPSPIPQTGSCARRPNGWRAALFILYPFPPITRSSH